jgi:hypothetical protein
MNKFSVKLKKFFMIPANGPQNECFSEEQSGAPSLQQGHNGFRTLSTLLSSPPDAAFNR